MVRGGAFVGRLGAWALAAAALGCAARAAEVPAGAIAVDLRDPRPVIAAKIGRGLTLRIRKESAADGNAGWTVEVTRRSRKDNLLYHSLQWHGPYPNQVYAWSEAARLWPAERELPVRGQPWVVKIACEGCATRGAGQDAAFTQGVLRVSWKRQEQPKRTTSPARAP